MFFLFFCVITLFCVWGWITMEHLGIFKRCGMDVKKIVLGMAIFVAASIFLQSRSNPFKTSPLISNPWLVIGSSPAEAPLAPPNLQNNLAEKIGLAPRLNFPTNDSQIDENGVISDIDIDEKQVNRNTMNNGNDKRADDSLSPKNSIKVSPPSWNTSVSGSDKMNINKGMDEKQTDSHANHSTTNNSTDKMDDDSLSPKNSNKASPPSRDSEFLKHKKELLLAKKEIDSYEGPDDDPDLYWPLYHNVSKFKKSYELMENIFKVYVYKEGPKPYFHQPELKGIYASEGWFMKLMDENRHFVVNNPRKAHMFYLPYSLYKLVVGMYIPESHSMRPISLFLRNYVNRIAAKYPFWNRTQGADHFFVACHDWGPYTTKEHPQLHKNAVKVLCNADLSEGYFVLGKDVSLPETTLRKPNHPTQNLGGKIVSERSILAFFAGNVHGRVRPVLLKYWKDKDDDMKIYELLPARVARKMSYADHMKSSKYCICPMGYEVNSPRIVEAISYECVPVIIADNFVPPLNEVLNWNAFSIMVAEKDIPKLKEILLSIPEKTYLSMHLRVRKVQRHFLWHKKPVKYDLFHMILHSIWYNRLNNIEP